MANTQAFSIGFYSINADTAFQSCLLSFQHGVLMKMFTMVLLQQQNNIKA